MEVLNKYADFVDVFLLKLAIELSKHIDIYFHVIEFIDDWQPIYSLIYSLGQMELKILKDLNIIWSTVLFNLSNLLQELLFSLIKKNIRA